MTRSAALALLLVVFGCEEEQEPPTDSTGAAASTSSTSPSTSTSSSSATSAASSDSGPQGPGVCVRECMLPADCCTGIDNCPGAAYPTNAACGEDGVCVPPTCADDGECDAETPGAVCRPVRGIMECVVLCDNDDPCAALGGNFSCGSPTDDGESYCNTRCTDGAIVCSPGECDDASGICICMSSSDCIPGFRCV